MAETFGEKVDRILRDHEGFTGDGRGGVGALPVGDRSTERKPILKRDLRDLFKDGQGLLAQAELYAEPRKNSITELAADTALTMSPGSPSSVTVGSVIRVTGDQAVFKVVAATEARPDLVTAGGVKLIVERWDRDDRGALAEIGMRGQNGQPVQIVVMGDSTAVGSDSTEAFNNWPNRLGSILRSITGNSNVLVGNGGVNGQRVSDWWAWDNFAARSITPWPTSEYIFLGFGANDVKLDGAPDWNPSIFIERYSRLITKARLAGLKVILVTPVLISAQNQWRPNARYQGELVQAVRKLAAMHRTDLVDINGMMREWQKNRRDQSRIGDEQPDGTHPLDLPHILIAQYVAKEILKDRVVNVTHGARLGPQDCSYSPSTVVSYNYNMSNAWGVSAQLTVTGNVNSAAEAWVWSDRARRLIYVSPDRSIQSGSELPAVYRDVIGTTGSLGVYVDFGAGVSEETDRPAENHIHVAILPYGLSRLRFRCPAAGTYEFGGWLVVDNFSPVTCMAYSLISSGKALMLPDFADSRPEITPKVTGTLAIGIIGDVPIGWGVVIGTQYVYDDEDDTGPSRRKQSIVAQRTEVGVDILRVLSDSTGVISATSIKTGGSGVWAGQMAVHCNVTGGNQRIEVRSSGQIVAYYDTGGTGVFYSPYGRLGGLYQDADLITNSVVGRQAAVTLAPNHF